MKVLSIGDLHFPYADKKLIKKLLKRIAEEKPNVVVQLGDVFDQYMFGRFDRQLGFINPEEEMGKAKKEAKKFWEQVKVAAPKAKRIQLLGNHDVRVLKSCLKKFPEIYPFIEKTHKDLYDFKGVEIMKSDRDFVEFDGIVYCHGWMAKHIKHFKKPVIRAHDHRVWLHVTSNSKKVDGKGLTINCSHKLIRSEEVVFEASVGMYANDKLLPFQYTSSRRTNWQAAITIATPDSVILEVIC